MFILTQKWNGGQTYLCFTNNLKSNQNQTGKSLKSAVLTFEKKKGSLMVSIVLLCICTV